MRRRSLLVLGTLAALACAGLAAWLGRDARPPTGVEEGSGQGPATADAPHLAANDRAAEEGYRIEDGVAVPQGRVSAEPGPGVLVVRVVDERDQPVPGRTVQGWTHGVPPWGPGGVRAARSHASEPIPPRRSDDEGLVRWRGLQDGEFVSVSISEAGWATASATTTVGRAPLTLRTMRLAECVVHVRRAGDAPVGHARVLLFAPPAEGEEASIGTGGRLGRPMAPWAERIASAETDAVGRAALSFPPTLTRGRLWVSADGFAPWADLAWSPHETEVRLEPAQEIVGVVRDTKGAVVADGIVRWETAQGLRGEEEVAWDGTFHIGDLPSTPVRLEWRLPDAPSLDGRNVQRVTPGTGTATFVVDLGGDVTIRIEGWPREPGGAAFLTPQEPAGAGDARLHAEIDLDGIARFHGLVPGRPYVLWVPPMWGLPWEPTPESKRGVAHRRDVTASADPVVVPWTAGRTVRGAVDLAGTNAAGPVTHEGPWRFLQVVLVGPGVELSGAVPNPVDSNDPHEIPFRVQGIPDGAFTLRATLQVQDAAGEDTWWVGELPVPAGDEPVRIRLRPAPPPEGRDR